MKRINKLLIANRGEIALRIIRSAREMGIKTVAIYSEADRNALHVLQADQAVSVGPAAVAESYLRSDRIVETALRMDVDAIHPGYGFLSENADFARLVEDSGILFVGPSPSSIQTMGDKIAAKKAVEANGIPLIPGTNSSLPDLKEASKVAKSIGFPVLIKASAGGGGKGMRIVWKEQEMEEQLERAMSEAKAAFGNGAVFLEKYIANPRHIEIQVLGDQHGNLVHLFERECSIQRRHQKIIEEAPSSLLTDRLREEMGQAAIKAAAACNYYGAGTVEFLVDEQQHFYFLEMNTRLQVEHPVTEMITGIDLVKEQIRIAEGHPLSFTQSDLTIQGHAFEVRVYAEDANTGFLPDTGKLVTYLPPSGPGIRVDDGYYQGMEVAVHYDPMIAKLITHAKDRKAAIQKMIRALEEYKIAGVKNTIDYCRTIFEHPKFQEGALSTRFIEAEMQTREAEEPLKSNREAAALLAAYLWSNNHPPQVSSLAEPSSEAINNWKKRRSGWS